MTTFIYKLKRMGYGSDRFGPCEICGEHADSTYYLVQMREFFFCRNIGGVDVKRHGITTDGCFAKFGHKDCLTVLTNI